MFDFPIEITLPEHVRKGPPPTVLEEEKPFLANRKKYENQSSCSALHQERAFRITASTFGEIVSKKAPVKEF